MNHTFFLAAVLWGMAANSALAQTGPVSPSTSLMPQPALGKKLFLQHCASCHGADLKGVAQGDKRGPPLLHKIYEPSHHGDAAFQLATRNGVRAHHWPYGDMAPVPGVTPDDVAHITAHVRAEQRRFGIQ